MFVREHVRPLLQTGELMHMPYLTAGFFQSGTTEYCIFICDKRVGFKNQIESTVLSMGFLIELTCHSSSCQWQIGFSTDLLLLNQCVYYGKRDTGSYWGSCEQNTGALRVFKINTK